MRVHTFRRDGIWRLLQLHINMHVKNFVKNTLVEKLKHTCPLYNNCTWCFGV